MKATPAKVIQLMVLLFAIIFQFSCSKDTDLLADYVISDVQEARLFANLAIDDFFVVAKDSEIVLDVLSNDSYENPEKVKIVNVSQPENGSVVVNEDKTLTYIPDSTDTPTETVDTPKESTETNDAPEESAGTDESFKDTSAESQAPEVSGTPEETAPEEEEKSTSESFTYTTETVSDNQTTETTEATVTVTTDSKSSDVSYGVDYYVTVSGNTNNDGRTEASAWSIEKAFQAAKAGDVVAIKSGNYGNKNLSVANSGTKDNPIRFIGYTDTPGDLVSSKGSTFKYGDQLDPKKIPLIQSAQVGKGTGITLNVNYLLIENFQITGYGSGIRSNGEHVVLRNIIATHFGNQNSYNAYDGFGLIIHGNESLLENCFVLNASAEAIKLYDSDKSRVNYCSVYADNPSNPTDYYYIVAGGTNNAIIENSYAERENSLKHGGHGFDLKDMAEYNTIRNCTVKRTSFELNFAGVRHNTIENCFIYGTGTQPKDWKAGLVIFNGANNNLIKNMYIQDTWTAISWADDNDGYVGPGGDRDEVSCGYDNTFENITIKNTNRIINSGGGKNYTASAERNMFINCDFSDFDAIAIVYYPTKDIKFKNCKFKNGNKAVIEAGGDYTPYSKSDFKFENCSWSNVKFTPPK